MRKSWNHFLARGYAVAAAALALVAAYAAAPSADIDIQPRVLQLGEAAQATITVRGERNPPPPPLSGLADCDVNGPSVNSQINITNGRMDQSVSFVYQLVPRRTGVIKVGPLNYKVGNQVLQLKGIELNVAAPTTASAAGGNKGVALSDLVSARLEVSPTNIFQNQSFELSLFILHREVRLDSGFTLLNWNPAGLSLSAFQELPGQRVMLNGQVFEMRQFRCTARALSGGKVRLAPTVRGGLVMPRERSQRGGPFNDPFFDRFFQDSLFNRPETRPLDIPTQPLDFIVRALPEAGRPKDFHGAVGKFTLEAQVKPPDGAVGDPVTLIARVTGNGNFDSISFPLMSNSEQFKTYEAKMTGKELDASQSSGSKTFEQVIIPKSMEAKRIPALTFSYFDIATNAYVTLSAGPFDLQLHPAAAGSSPIASANGLGTTITTPTGRDIAYLKPAPAQWSSGHEMSLTATPLFWSLQALPPLAVLAAFILARSRDVRAGDVRIVRREQAPRSARRALRTAEQALAHGQRAAFYEALADSLRSYFGHRFNLPPGDVTADNLQQRLAAVQVEATLAGQVTSLFELCDRERFGATGATTLDVEASRRAVDDIARLLRQFERVRL
ncbi:MAG: BatD family protein [Kiritimatiellaeota bacterium]|nr:BatD family protein [Kiritimatiellota bacterium]